jgi:hypothetical protein
VIELLFVCAGTYSNRIIMEKPEALNTFGPNKMTTFTQSYILVVNVCMYGKRDQTGF